MRGISCSVALEKVLFQEKHIPEFYNTRANYISHSQGTLAGCRREPSNSTRQPTAQELVSNLSGLSALTEGTQRSYQRAWVIF